MNHLIDITAAPRIEFIGRTGKSAMTSKGAVAFRVPHFGLEFALKPLKASSHAEAVRLASECDLLNHKDWRLPERKELELLVNLAALNPATWPELVKHTPTGDWYWSATDHTSDPGYAWLVHFGGGNVYYNRRYASGFVRAVRAVPPSQ